MNIEDFMMAKTSSFSNFHFTLNTFKFWRKHSSSLTINEGQTTQKVIYLGNVLTAWAKGEASVNRALETLWTNYQKKKSFIEIQMRLTICNSGLKAETKQFGLTEYWANRITFCCWKSNHPKVFCWVYRHVGRRGKPELRCHAVLCQKEEIARRMSKLLEERLSMALKEFLREKMLRQKAQNSLMEIPLRKQLLVKGMANFRQPIERSRSAPKLMAIFEDSEREEEEERELSKLFDKIDEDELVDDFGEMSSISIEDDDIEQMMSLKKGNKLSNGQNDDDDDEGDNDDENDSAIDSESFKSDEIVYSTNG